MMQTAQDVVFDRAWFQRHEGALLRWANHPLTWRLARRVLAIRPGDVGFSRPLVGLSPSSYTVLLGVDHEQLILQTDFRTHDKFAKRLRFQLNPLWQTLHAWDLVADPLLPQLSFGFNTLTAYPDAGNPGSTTADSFIHRNGVDETWSTIRTSAGNSIDDTSAGNMYAFHMNASTTSSQWSRLARSFFHFDTSGLGSGASISAADFSISGQDKQDTLGVTPNANIYASTVSSNNTFATSDFTQIGSTAFATAVSYASLNAAGYTTFNLNASGLAAISTTGVTKLALRNANYDAANSAPTWTSGAFAYYFTYSADATGTTNDPKLVVTYTVGGAPVMAAYLQRRRK